MKSYHESITTLDIRPLLANGQEPLPNILHAAKALQDGQTLKLLAPFEPLPLYLRMDAMGFTHQTEKISDPSGPLWMILFSKKKPSPQSPSAGLQTLDIRNIQTDTAAAMISRELNALAYDDVLKIQHIAPLPLEIDAGKYQWKSQPGAANGESITRIWRRN